jgi:hypothetical protein
LFLALTFAAISAAADISETDLQLAARTLTFMEQPLSGRVRLGIVYSSASPRSLNQAQALAAQLESGLIVGNIELRPVLVPIERADTADVDLFLMTEFLPPESSHLATISARRQITCVTTDIRQVESGACAIAIRSQPKIEIIVNREAAANSGVRFATAFRVMVTEL